MIPDKLTEILQHEAPTAIATQGPDGPHLVNTWNSYVQVTEAGELLIPVGFMKVTEENLNTDSRVLLTIASREVAGTIGPGAGFLITGTAKVEAAGSAFETVKARFSWARAALVVTVDDARQTI
jgi:hypothetical protein